MTQQNKTRMGVTAAASFALAVGLAACNNDSLTAVNNNPNAPVDAPATALFTNAVQTGVSRWLGSGYDLRNLELIVQHLAENQYIGNDVYAGVAASSLSGTFTGAYSGELEDLQIVARKGAAASDVTITDPAVIFQQWEYGYLTDTWGDVPYSQALAGDSSTKILSPMYDTQKAIYAGMMAKLQKASTELAGKSSGSLGTADPIYNGSPAAWGKFANSLHARDAMRIVNIDPTTASAELKAAFTAPGGVFTSNADNAVLKWPGDGIYNNPWAVNFASRDDDRMSKTFIDTLNANKDPRLPIFAMPAEADGQFVGQPNGLTNATAVAYSSSSSRPGAVFYPGPVPYGSGNYGGAGNSYPSYLMTYAEVAFIQAEAAERGLGGLTAGQAAGFYTAGITASMQQWGVKAADIATYLAQPSVAYKGGAAGLKQIATQKWIALYSDGGQAWFEWRRTCVPNIKPGPAAKLSYVPRRVKYPSAEASANADAIAAAVADQGPDANNTPVWWDKTANAPTCK